VTLALLSGVAYAGVVAYAASREPTLAPVVATIGAFGAVLLLFVLVRGHDDLLGWALALGGLAYALAVIAHGTHVDEAAPLIGAGLLVCGELATWSLDERWSIARARGLLAARAGAVAVLALTGLAAGALVVSLAAAPAGNGLVWTLFGSTAAVLVVAVAAVLSRR
jgi:hypothetical protein